MDEKLAERIGAIAREARLRAGLTQADVAERLGIVAEVYGRLERGKMLPSVDTLKRLAQSLRVSADELLGLSEAGAETAALPPPAGDNPAIRRLVRRASRLGRRQLRILILVAAALAR